MSSHAKATLFWGFASTAADEPLVPRLEDYGDDPTDWEEVYADRIGIARPAAEYGPDSRLAHEEFWDQKQQAVDRCACEIGRYGMSDYGKEYVCVRMSKAVAYTGGLTAIGSLGVGTAWEGQLRRFCELMGIAWQEPGWKLVAYYG